MKMGYGRGYYGEEQLARPPVRRRSVWSKLALAAGVVGAGAVIWFMWPRKPKYEPGIGGGPLPSPPGPLPLGQESLPYEAVSFPGAEARGYAHSYPPGGQARGYAHSSPSGAEVRGYAHSMAGGSFPGAEGYAHSAPPGSEARGYAHSAPPGSEARGGTVRRLPPGEALSQQDYEDAVVADARQLQAAGAKIVLAPHLAHLASRIA